MNFVQPAFLAALGALSIPLVIHFLRSRKLKVLDLGTLRFVNEAMSETTRWQRLRDWLLLLMRLLMVALAALLFARPFRDEIPPPPGQEAGTEWLCVLDASASMRFQLPSVRASTRPPANAAAELFQKHFKNVPEGIRAVPVLLADSLKELPSPEALADETGGPCDYAALTRWVKARIAADPRMSRRVFLFTDLQQPATALPEDANWPAEVPLEIVSVLPPSVSNISLSPPLQRVQPFVKDQPATIALPLTRSGPGLAKKLTAVTMAKGQKPGRVLQPNDGQEAQEKEYGPDADNVELILTPSQPGDLVGQARIKSSDPWPLDDFCDVSVRFTGRVPVLLLDGDRGAEAAGADPFGTPADSPFASETYYLRQALQTPNKGQSASSFEVSASHQPLENLEDRPWRAIAVCNVDALSEDALATLSAKVKAGCGLLLFPGSTLDAAGWKRLTDAGLCPATVEFHQNPAVPRPLAVWDAKHPALVSFAAREQGDLSRVILQDRFRVMPSPGATVLASMDGKRPVLVAGTLGKGNVLLFANPVDRAWSDFPSEKLFLPVMRALFNFAAGLGTDEEAGLPEARDITLADNLLPGLQGGRILYVSKEESTAPFLDETAFRTALRLGAAPAPVALGETEAWRKVEGAARPDEWWPWFALALLIFLIAETFLADHSRPAKTAAVLRGTAPTANA